MQKTLLRRRKFIVVYLLAINALFFSCMDKKEYEMELKFQRQLTAQYLYENDRILWRIEKENKDHGGRFSPIKEHATKIIDQRNKSIDSFDLFIAVVDKMKQEKNLSTISGEGSIELLNYYQKEFLDKHDSLVFQKLINLYLSIEVKILNEGLMNMASCNWGSWHDAHVTKTTDTVRAGNIYELAVIPDSYDHKFSFVNDDCKITVYENDAPIEMKHTILKRGSVYLISLSPTKPGNYELRGSFTQSARLHPYVMQLKFVDSFVVR